MAGSELRCPVCKEPLKPEPRLFGLIRRYPTHCPSCGTGLAYDTTGGVFAVPAAKPGPPGAAKD